MAQSLRCLPWKHELSATPLLAGMDTGDVSLARHSRQSVSFRERPRLKILGEVIDINLRPPHACAPTCMLIHTHAQTYICHTCTRL